MLDTTVFNDLLSGGIDPSSVPKHLRLFVTHVQLNEIQNASSSERRQALLAMFTVVDSTQVPTASAVWGVSEWGAAEWGSQDGLFESLLIKLNEKNKSKNNNVRDVLIAETAIQRNLVLVTDDSDLAEVVRNTGGTVMGHAQLLSDSHAC